jgi:hypothetical protein
MMAIKGDFDGSITRWLEETAPARLPERVLESTFELTRTSRQHVDWRRLLGRSAVTLPALALGGAVVIVAAVIVTANVAVDRVGLGAPQPTADAFLGTWVSTSDADGGTQTMTVRASADGALEIVVTDTVATVCSRHPSKMTGTGRLDGGTRLVIPAPVYTCDDGSEPKPLSGPPLADQLRNMTFIHDPASDTLTVGAGSLSVWRREGAAQATPEPAVAVAEGKTWDPSRFPGTWASTAADAGFLGTWEATDVDGSSLLLGVRKAEAAPDGLEVVLLDDRAGGGRRRWPESDWPWALCSIDAETAGPITMTGIGRVDGLALAVDAQTWLCGQRALSGPSVVTGDRSFDLKQAYVPLVHDPETDTLVGPAGVVWHHRPTGSDPIRVPYWGVWPQSTLTEAEKAQRQADAGDPAFTWQLAPELATPPQFVDYPFPARLPAPDAADGAEILTRYFRDVLGWDRYLTVSRLAPDEAGNVGWVFQRIHCGPGKNPLYPSDAVGGDCPPTIGDTTYETVSVSLMQPVRTGPSGIWVVTSKTVLAPSTEPHSDIRHHDWMRQFTQVVPPTKAEVVDATEAFLSARVAGAGAEAYLTEGYAEPSPTVPLLYATINGDRYERFEIADVQEWPDWPSGSYGLTVRLFARGGKDVVEQQFQVWPGSRGQLTMDTMMTTTENGVEVPDPIVSE